MGETRGLGSAESVKNVSLWAGGNRRDRGELPRLLAKVPAQCYVEVKVAYRVDAGDAVGFLFADRSARLIARLEKSATKRNNVTAPL